MASRLWGYWGSTPAPQFPEPPRNPLAYCPHGSANPPSSSVSSVPSSSVADHNVPELDEKPEIIGKNLDESSERDELEEVAFSAAPVEEAREENAEYRLLVKRYIAKELVAGAIQRWKETLSWLPMDVPAKLELSPIVAQFVPFYVFSAHLELTCSGEYEVDTGNGQKETAKTEIQAKEVLNEILVCASTDIHPTLMDELFAAKAFHPPATNAGKAGGTAQTGPPIPRHPYHAVIYRHHLYAPQLTSEAEVLQADIPVDLSNQMISDYLIHEAGPFLALQAFRTQFGADARNLHASASIRQLVRHLLLLPIYLTSYEYHEKPYYIVVSGINAHVVGQRMSWGTGQLGRALSSVSSGISKIVSNNV